VALWEALYKRRPFAAAKFRELAEEVNAGRIVAPPSATQVPARIRQALERGLAVAPDQRWPRWPSSSTSSKHPPATAAVDVDHRDGGDGGDAGWASYRRREVDVSAARVRGTTRGRADSRAHSLIRGATRRGSDPEALSLAIQAAARVEGEAVSSEQRSR